MHELLQVLAGVALFIACLFWYRWIRDELHRPHRYNVHMSTNCENSSTPRHRGADGKLKSAPASKPEPKLTDQTKPKARRPRKPQ